MPTGFLIKRLGPQELVRLTRRVAVALLIVTSASAIWFFLRWLPLRAVKAEPVVSGRIVSQDRVGMGPSGLELVIRIEGSSSTVRANVRSGLAGKLPELVRFHYDGNPSREVFLHEHEEDPFWIFLLSLSCAVFGSWAAFFASNRTLLWSPKWFRR